MKQINVFGASLDIRPVLFISSVTTCLVLLNFLRSSGNTSFVRHLQSRTNYIARTEEAKNELTAGPVSVCKDKIEHFVMVKIEKTGTSTLFGILARFATSHRLNILTAKSTHISWTGVNEGKGTWKIGPEAVDRADVLLNHARYNKSIFDKYIKKNYKLIVPVREPVSWMRSAIKYFGPIANIRQRNPDEVIRNDSLLFKRRPVSLSGLMTWFHLPQLQWLGFDYNKRNNLTEIKTFISDIVPRIDIPIITDQYDASLLIMKKRLCWEYTDIFYMSRNVRRSSHLFISSQAVKKLLSLEVNLGDKLLYEAVNKTWWQQPELKERDFWKEATYFSQLNQKVSSQICPGVLKSNDPKMVEATDHHQMLLITQALCRRVKNVGVSCAQEYANHNPC